MYQIGENRIQQMHYVK